MIRKTTPMAILVQRPDKQKPGGGTGLPTVSCGARLRGCRGSAPLGFHLFNDGGAMKFRWGLSALKSPLAPNHSECVTKAGTADGEQENGTKLIVPISACPNRRRRNRDRIEPHLRELGFQACDLAADGHQALSHAISNYRPHGCTSRRKSTGH